MVSSDAVCRVTDLTVTAGAFLNVTDNAAIGGRFSAFHPMTMSVGSTLTLGSASVLELRVTVLPPLSTRPGGGQFFVVPIATFGSLTGRLAHLTVAMNYAFSRASATSQPCYVPTNSTPVYTSSTLAVAVDVQNCASDGGLSTGAIVGIAVGAAAAGVLLIVVLVLVVSSFWFRRVSFFGSHFVPQLHNSTKARTARMNKELRGKELHELSV